MRVRNIHTADVAGIAPGEEGDVPAWVADGPLRLMLVRVDAPEPDLTDAPGVRYERAEEPEPPKPPRRKRGR